MENKIQQLFLEKDQISLQKDILPLVLEEFKLLQMNDEMYVMACEFVKQQLCALYVAGMSVVCYPIFDGNPQQSKIVVVDMTWEVVER